MNEILLANFVQVNRDDLFTVKCSDRYIVVSASGEGVETVLMLAKLFDLIWQENGRKNPRRSIIFCLSSGSNNPCQEILSKLETYEVMAYIEIHPEAFQGLSQVKVQK